MNEGAALFDPARAPDVGDYAAIGNCQSVALVSRDGSIDWCCLPHFSSPSVFAALLDAESGGRFALRPRDVVGVERAYLDDTNVLRTVFHCASGTVELTDFMAMPANGQAMALRPQHEIARRLTCTGGTVVYDVVYQPRPDYARRVPTLRRRGRLGWMCTHRGDVLLLQAAIDLAPSSPGVLTGSGRLDAGTSHSFLLGFTQNDLAVVAPLERRVAESLAGTVEWWRTWSARCAYAGPYRRAVIRSALALKLLTYSLSGAVVAAATTSLPEDDVGERNWDYRYCWLRDAGMVLQCFSDLGYASESYAYLGWLLHATRLTRPELQVMYDVHGDAELPEEVLGHLAGWRGCAPVRVGNGAWQQVQIDVYGEVLLTAYEFAEAGGVLDPGEQRLVRTFADTVCRIWRRPDQGLWEKRSGARHHTHSKLMCWVALDRLLRLAELTALQIDRERVTRERDAIRAEIDARAWNPTLDSYVSEYDGDEPDASLLLLSRHGYLDAGDPRMTGTRRLVERRLALGDFMYRYCPGSGDGMDSRENPFGICSFWLVEHLADAGEADRAEQLFERLLAHGNDLGLYAEMFHRDDGRPVGNFPQAFTHVGLIAAAIAIERARGRPVPEYAR